MRKSARPDPVEGVKGNHDSYSDSDFFRVTQMAEA